MNHGNKVNHLGRTASHRKAMMANMASSLILHKRITTTVAKAKALRKYVEPLITKAKNDTTHSRRTVFSYLKYKEPVIELFAEVAGKVADRPGGYTRILKTGNRLGDNAEMCIIELVDFNETYSSSKKAAGGSKTRRKRTSKKKTEGAADADATETAAAAPKAPAKKKAAPKADAEKKAAAPKKKAAPKAEKKNEENDNQAE